MELISEQKGIAVFYAVVSWFRERAKLVSGAERGGRWSHGWSVAAAVAVVFAADVATPLGYSVPMFYVLPLFLTRFISDLPSTLLTGVGTVVLTWAGAVASPHALAQHDGPNRAMVTVLLLGTAWALITKKRSDRRIITAQRARYESEERLRLFIDHAPVALAMFDSDMRYLAVSRRWISEYGLEGKQVIGQFHYELFRDIPDRWKVAHRRGLAGEIVREEEDRFELTDGSEKWLCWEVRPWRGDDGNVRGIVIFTEDITDRKQVELAMFQNQRDLRNQEIQLRELAAKLMTAQEEERKRIARDLHDDFTQQLAVLTIDLQSLVDMQSDESHAQRLKQLGDKAEQLTGELQRLAHQLHPSLLEHVGLEAATREYADEFATRTGLTTEVMVRNVPLSIPLEQATCLYRVLQESLQNVRKHAEATTVLVSLRLEGAGVEICIHDDGRGFQQAADANVLQGLGLTSMSERVRALGGTFRAETSEGVGTEIYAWLPLAEVTDTRRLLATIV